MFEVKIINKTSLLQTHGARFPTRNEADAWIVEQISKGERCGWGRPAWTETIYSEEGLEIERIEHEASFTVEILDHRGAINEALRQEEVRHLARSQALERLKDIDNANSIIALRAMVKDLMLVVSEAVKDGR
jgi:hypothetical protein